MLLPAPPKDQIKGSKKNPKGSAGGDSDEPTGFLNNREIYSKSC